MAESPVTTVRRNLRASNLKSLEEGKRLRQVKEFANYACRAFLFRLALATPTDTRSDILELADASAKSKENGSGSGHEDETNHQSLYRITAARPITAQNIGDPDIAKLVRIGNRKVKHSTADFLHQFSMVQKIWRSEREHEHWKSFLLGYPFPNRIHQIVVFDQGRPIERRGLTDRGEGILRQYAQVLDMQGWLRNATVSLQSQICPEEDEEALSSLGFKVLNGAYGVHEGFALVDDNTVVVDFNSLFPIRRIVFEIAKPAVIICPRFPEVPDPDVSDFTVLDKDINDGKELVIPGHFLRDPCMERVCNIVKNEYIEAKPLGVKFGRDCGLGEGLVAYFRKISY